MYKATFINDNGEKFFLGVDGDNVCDIDFAEGMDLNLGRTQGFAQIGESVENISVGGRTVNIKGCFFKNIVNQKNFMRKIFAPFMKGKLLFEDKYFLRVVVKKTPTFAEERNNGKFMIQLFAPFPFYYGESESVTEMNKVTPQFRYPINYSKPHRFGTSSDTKSVVLRNDGDIETPLQVIFTANGASVNPQISNLTDFRKLKLNGTLGAGEQIRVYRDDDNVLHVEKVKGDVTENAMGMLSDDSDLFTLKVGDNLLAVSDESGSSNLSVTLAYRKIVVSVYEN